MKIDFLNMVTHILIAVNVFVDLLMELHLKVFYFNI